MVNCPADDVASLVLSTYARSKFKPPDGQFSVLAGFVLSAGEAIKVISLGTGSKCLPATRLPQNGDALHDSHAEVLARRGVIRWLLEEISRSCEAQPSTSRWISRGQDGKYALNTDVKLDIYISTVPCRCYKPLYHHPLGFNCSNRRGRLHSISGVIPRRRDGCPEGLHPVPRAPARHRIPGTG